MIKHSYQSFLKAADQHFDDIQQSHSQSFKCQSGCHACCEPGLTVLPIEAANIRLYLEENPDVVEIINELELTNPHKGSRCSLLTKDGMCTIYNVRPFICRSHGAPIAISREEYFQIDVCPLNFTENPIEHLGPENFFILDEWNDDLCSVDQGGQRIALNVNALLALDY